MKCESPSAAYAAMWKTWVKRCSRKRSSTSSGFVTEPRRRSRQAGRSRVPAAEVVEDDDLAAGVEQVPRDVGADEPGAAGDEDRHRNVRLAARAVSARQAREDHGVRNPKEDVRENSSLFDARSCRGCVRSARRHSRRGNVAAHQPEGLLLGRGHAERREHADQLQNDLIYHGGNAGAGAIGVEQKPAVYLICWGPEWADGLQDAPTPTASSTRARRCRTTSRRSSANVGGSGWANIQTQYCRNVPAGATNCAGGSGFVTNPKHQLKGVWTDPTPVPSDIVTLGLAENLVDDPIAAEALRAAAHFGYNPQATYIILTPPRTLGTGSPSTAATTRRRRASTGSATRTASSTRSSPG